MSIVCTLLTFPLPCMSVKWESDSKFPPSHISSATHTGDNEFELDRVPLGQVGSVLGYGKTCNGWESWKVRVKEE